MDQFELTAYLVKNFPQVWARFLEHLGIAGTALGLAVLIALPAGLLLSRVHRLAGPVLIALGIIYTIPSFALFAVLVPITGIGAQPAIIALVAYALFILVRNTMVAFDGVDGAVLEAAQGMGMSAWQRLWRIEWPLALPVILAGVRIATLSTVSLTTIAAWIGAGGLGQLLRDGVTYPSELYAGVIAVAVMAIGADVLFRGLERLVRPRGERRQASAVPAPVPVEA
jgi:osmoprotectant transport system permease protein